LQVVRGGGADRLDLIVRQRAPGARSPSSCRCSRNGAAMAKVIKRAYLDASFLRNVTRFDPLR
jgi:hypothetical protein